ncbi:MAG: hypothetical protein PGN13_08405 [Patulibacter minatonensis]
MTDPFDELEQRLRAGVAQARPRRSRRLLAAWRLPAIVAAVIVGGGGVAVAARALLLERGVPVPDSGRQLPADMTPSRPRVVLTAADPVGGLPWGLAVFRRAHGHGLTCQFVGRTQGGEVGVVGQDGAFGDDGRFHPLGARSTKSMGCGGGDPQTGQFIGGGSGPPTAASGYSGDPDAVAGGRPIGGCTPSFERRRPGRSICAADQMRQLKFGFAGGDAVRVTYGNRRVQRTVVPPRGSAGAYLFVLAPGEGAGGGPKVLRVTYADGGTCTGERFEAPRPGEASSDAQPCPRMPRSHEPQRLLMP